MDRQLYQLHEAGLTWSEIGALLGIAATESHRLSTGAQVAPGIEHKVARLHELLIQPRPDLSALQRQEWMRTRTSSGLAPLEQALLELQRNGGIGPARRWNDPSAHRRT